MIQHKILYCLKILEIMDICIDFILSKPLFPSSPPLKVDRSISMQHKIYMCPSIPSNFDIADNRRENKLWLIYSEGICFSI